MAALGIAEPWRRSTDRWRYYLVAGISVTSVVLLVVLALTSLVLVLLQAVGSYSLTYTLLVIALVFLLLDVIVLIGVRIDFPETTEKPPVG